MKHGAIASCYCYRWRYPSVVVGHDASDKRQLALSARRPRRRFEGCVQLDEQTCGCDYDPRDKGDETGE
jgi:hypothetical protein